MEELFYEIFIDLPRQGPGDKESTLKALKIIYKKKDYVNILDIGCGTGNQTLHLAQEINGKIIALDNYKPFLDILYEEAKKLQLESKIKCQVGDMFKLDFKNETFDIIWSEGAVYQYGLMNALKNWKKFIKPNGYFVLSEFNWLDKNPPKEVNDYFTQEAPDACSIDETKKIIINSGYELLNHFIIPEQDWHNFYNSLEKQLEIFREKYKDDLKALELINSLQYEIDLFRKYTGSYGYVFYVMQKK
ncbi:MAG: methyltransferase domain-containing protein [Bacteroidales bacterium]|nr:methyltransferase domain-containing protein [Bacteroidales bacterium]